MSQNTWMRRAFLFVVAVCATCNVLYKSSASDLEDVCRKVIATSSVWGSKILRFTPVCPEKLLGLGPKVLEVAAISPSFGDIGKTTCYAPISNALCSVKFDTYNALPGCRTTVQTFFKIVATCLKAPGFAGAHCPTLDVTTQIISDPIKFCAEAAMREDGPEDPKTGLPESYKMHTFESGEQQDCQQSVMTYNTCRRIGVGQLNYTLDYCLGQGFEAYCDRTINVVRDDQFYLSCENIIVPAFVNYAIRHHGRINDHFCDNVFAKWLTYLSSRKGEAFIKARAAKHSLESSGRTISYINEYKIPLLKSSAIDAAYINTFNPIQDVINSLEHYRSGYNLGYTQTLYQTFQHYETQINTTYNFAKTIRLPSVQHDGSVSFENMKQITAMLSEVNALESKVLISSQTLLKLMNEYLSSVTTMANNGMIIMTNNLAQFSYPIPETMLLNIHQSILETVQHMSNFRKIYDRMLNVWSHLHTTKDQDFINTGIRQTRLAQLRDAQIKLLISLNGKAEASQIIETAMKKI